MAGHSLSKTGVNALMPGIQDFRRLKQDVDARDKRGHDDVEMRRRATDQYLFAIGNSSAGNSVITRQPLSVTTTSSSMRAAE
jgi:hypothetical protein